MAVIVHAAALADPISPEDAASAAEPEAAIFIDSTPVERGIDQATSDALVDQQIENDRGALLRQDYHPRPPTWVQHASTINLGDYPTLDDPLGRADREVQTLEWLIEQRRLDALREGKRPLDEGDGPVATLRDWLRTLLPGTWFPWVKANRDWLLATAVLVALLMWAAALFDRRPVARGRSVLAAEPAERPASARGRRRSATDAARTVQPIAGAPHAAGAASTDDGASAPDRRRGRRRRRHGHGTHRDRRPKALPWWVRWFSPSRGA